jgi:hypothetical protein
MPIAKRQGNNPKRRLEPSGCHSQEILTELADRLTYVGSANHKLTPGDYRFHPPTNPRATKDVCDDKRQLLLAEAQALLRAGVLAGMVSSFADGGVPKYVWMVDGAREVYEAKTAPDRETHYHGYRLGDDDSAMRDLIRKEWIMRCL